MFFLVMSILTLWVNYEAAVERELEYVVVVKTASAEEGLPLMLQRDNSLTLLLMEATHFVHNLLYANPSYPRKHIHTVVLSIDNNHKESAVYEDNEIHINSEYIADLVEEEIRGLVYRKTGRLWLWNGGRKAPLGLLEGMAEYITLAAGFNVSDPSVLMNQLNNSEQRWDAGRMVTGMYLQYCEGIKTGFVAALNALMEEEWKEDFINELLGKSATMVWSEFKKIIQNKIMLKNGTALPGTETASVSGNASFS